MFIPLLATTLLCQTDTLDTIVLANGGSIKGKVISIKQNTIEFVESSTSIIYEYDTSKISSVILSSGKVINFTTPVSSTTKQVEELGEDNTDTIDVHVKIGGGALIVFKSDNYDAAVGGNLLLELRPKSFLAVRADYAWYSADTKVDYLSTGNASFYAFELTLLIRSMRGTIQPYGGIGIGYYEIDNLLDSELNSYLYQYGLKASEEVDDGIGFFLRGGIDGFFGSGLGMFMEFKYWIYNPTVTTTIYELSSNQEYSSSSEIRLNNLNLIIGLVFII